MAGKLLISQLLRRQTEYNSADANRQSLAEIVFLQKVTLWDAEVIDFGVGKEVSDNQLTLYLL